MGTRARYYAQGTRAALAALSRGACYFPKCERPIIVFDELGEPYIDYQIAHIFDAKIGNRHREDMTDDERREFSNLILLCKPHHERVDKRHPDEYPPEVLLAWKEEREAGGVAALGALGAISPDELADQLVELVGIEFNSAVVNLGGTGGSAPGAGGGGGGVVGNGTGGPGGPGGNFSLEGQPGTAPGAGGGGGAAVGADAFGGEGGGGGQRASGSFDVEPGDVLRVHVGEGGRDGRAGEDTYVERIDRDGNVTELIRARGGRSGRSGIEFRDLRDGPSIRVTSAFFCDAAQIKNGVLNVWGGGWDHVEYQVMPATFSCVVALIAEVLLPGPRETAVSFELVDSKGIVRIKDVLPLAYDVHPEPHRLCLVHAFSDHEVARPGIWHVLIASAGQTLVTLDISLTQTDPPGDGD